MPVNGLGLAKLLLDAIKFLDGRFTNHDQQEFKTLLRELTDYRLLTSPYFAEYAGAVVASADKLRSLLVSTAKALPENSGIEPGILALGRTVRQFLSAVDAIESVIRHQLQLIEDNAAHGSPPDESSAIFLSHWKRLGYPERILRNNFKINVMEIEWEGFRMQFLVAFGNLRGEFSIILTTLCELLATELPEDLSSLTQGLNEFRYDT